MSVPRGKMEADLSDDGGWTTAGKKTKKPDADFPTVVKTMKKSVIALAGDHPHKIVCVFYSRRGKQVSSGYSTWKENERVSERDVLTKVVGASTRFSATARQFGTACAEVCASYYQTSGAKYSLAYDSRTKQFKAACKNCSKLLVENNMQDVYTFV